MPIAKYIKVFIDDQQADVDEAVEDISISYKLEDTVDFQVKKAPTIFSLSVPATTTNDRICNTYHNAGVEDMTSGNTFSGTRKGVVEANGCELLVGKAFLTNAKHNSRPLSYQFDFYGGNADWIIDMQLLTMYDCLQHLSMQFTKANIMASWLYNGNDPNLPFVFAPVRYGIPMGVIDNDTTSSTYGQYDDRNMLPEYMKPSISKYWVIYWAFQTLGYKIVSNFFGTEYFRRQVMPWTWGSFLQSEGTRLESLNFLAKSVNQVTLIHTSFDGIWDVGCSNDSALGAFDNNNTYTWDGTAKEGKWTYPTAPQFDFGPLEAHFHFAIDVEALVSWGSEVKLHVYWYKNGNQFRDHELLHLHANVGLLTGIDGNKKEFNGTLEDWAFYPGVVQPGDVISFKVYAFSDPGSSISGCKLKAQVSEFKLDYFKVTLGGTISFSNLIGLKNYNFLDFLRGVVDEFNLMPITDSVNKVVYFEPAHEYSLTNDLSQKNPGHFNGDFIDWEEKQDLSDDKVSEMDHFSDGDRQLIFKYKDDGNDGILKIVQDRNALSKVISSQVVNTLGASMFVLPDRFQTGISPAVENRFFSPLMHYDVDQWTAITGVAPQMPVMIPENVSNTSAAEAQNTFSPKSAYYKGLVPGWGWIFDGVNQTSFPFMFAVNYRTGGENDPILSYSDEKIGATPVIGKGLLRRFYLQRMAIVRNGQYYKTFFKLNNSDVDNFQHREHVICQGQRWELVEINDYKPLKEESTACSLRKWTPVTSYDLNNVYPSQSVVAGSAPINSFDINYSPLKCLPGDISVNL